MPTLEVIHLTNEKKDGLREIYNKIADLLDDEIMKMTPNNAERIVFCHLIIEEMHNRNLEALKKMGMMIGDGNDLEMMKEK
jgi:hypothetical protein